MQATQIATEIYLAKKSYAEAEQLISPYATVPQSLRTEEERTIHYRNLYLLALAHRGQGKYAVASELLGRVRLESVSSDLAERVMLARIETSVAANEFNQANQQSFNFEGRYPNSRLLPAVRTQMIRSFIASKRMNEANIKFRQLQNMQDSETYTARAARFLGEAAYQQGDLDNARIAFQALQRTQQSDDDLSQAISGLAWIDYKQKNVESAAEGFGQFIASFPEHPSIWKTRLVHAESLRKLNKNREAIATLEPFETLPIAHPLRPRGLYQLAELLKNDPQYEGRVSQLVSQILVDHPTFEQRDAALYFSAMHDRKQRNVTATTKFKEIVQQHPSSDFWSDALYRLAESAHSQKDNMAANQYLTKLISAERDQDVMPHALFMKGRLESDAKNWSEARATLRDLLRKFPSSKLVPVARYGVAESFFQQKEFDRAYQLFEILKREQKFDKTDTWGAMVQLRCAQLEVQRKNLVAATSVAQQIEADYPNFPLQHEVDYLVGRVAAARGEFSQARTAYEKVVAKDSTYEREISAMAQWMIGETYFHQKKYILAIKAYEALLADLKYDNWQAASHLQIGKCYELLENPDQAQNSYTRVTTRHGESKWAEEAKQRLDVLKQAS